MHRYIIVDEALDTYSLNENNTFGQTDIIRFNNFLI